MWEWIRNRHVLNTSVILQARDHCQKVAKNIANPGARANLPNGHSHAEAVRLGAWAFHQHVICIDMIQLLSNLLFLYVFVFQTKSRAKIIPGALAQTGLCNHPSTCRRCIRHLNGWIGDVSAENFGGMKRVEGYPISSEDCQVPHVYSWLLFPRVSHTIWFYLCIYLILFVYRYIYWTGLFLCFFVSLFVSWLLCFLVWLFFVHVHNALHGIISSRLHGRDWNPDTFHSNSFKLTEGWDEMNKLICSILVHSLIGSVPFCSLNQGSGFGELALQDDAPRAATIITCVGVPQDERGGERWVFGAKAGGERRCWVEVFVKSKKHVIWGLSWIKLTTPYQGIWHWVFVLSFMSKIIRKWLLFLAFHWRKLDSEPGKQSLSIVWNLKSLTKFGGSNFLRHLVM